LERAHHLVDLVLELVERDGKVKVRVRPRAGIDVSKSDLCQ